MEQNNENNKNDLTIVETFVGCGGSYLGFKNNGFRTIFVNDMWDDSLQTLKYNNSSLTEDIICEDINELIKRDICLEFNIKKYELDVLMGGVVCQRIFISWCKKPF